MSDPMEEGEGKDRYSCCAPDVKGFVCRGTLIFMMREGTSIFTMRPSY